MSRTIVMRSAQSALLALPLVLMMGVLAPPAQAAATKRRPKATAKASVPWMLKIARRVRPNPVLGAPLELAPAERQLRTHKRLAYLSAALALLSAAMATDIVLRSNRAPTPTSIRAEPKPNTCPPSIEDGPNRRAIWVQAPSSATLPLLASALHRLQPPL